MSKTVTNSDSQWTDSFKEESVNHDLDPLRDETHLQRAFFGCILVDERAFNIAATYGVAPEWFATPSYGVLWRAALRLHSEGAPIDPILLHEASEKVINKDDIASCAHGISDAAGMETIVKRLRTLYQQRRKRELLEEGLRVVSKTHFSEEENAKVFRPILAKLEETCLPLRGLQGQDRLSSHLEQLRERGDGTEDQSHWVTTGIFDLDKKFGACEPGRLWITAARSHTGKSALSHWINYTNLRAGRTVFFFPNEDKLEDAVSIMASQAAGVNLRHLDQEPKDKMTKFLETYQWITDQYEKTFFCWDQLRDYAEIASRIRLTIRKGVHPDLVGIDHLCRVRLSGKWDRNDIMFGEIASSFRALAQAEGFTALATSQLNRSALDGEPTERDAAESDKIFMEADRYWLMWIPKEIPFGDMKGTVQTDDDMLVHMLINQKKGRGMGVGRAWCRFFRPAQQFLPAK